MNSLKTLRLWRMPLLVATLIMFCSVRVAFAEQDEWSLSLGPIISLYSQHEQLTTGLGMQVTVYYGLLDTFSVHIRTAVSRFGSLHDDAFGYSGQLRELYYDKLHLQLTPYVLYHIGYQIRLSIGAGMSYLATNDYNRTVTTSDAIIIGNVDNEWRHAYGFDGIVRLSIRVSRRFAAGLINHVTMPILGHHTKTPYITTGIGLTYYTY